MRKPIIAGNWKMNLTPAESAALAAAVAEATAGATDAVDVVVGPTMVSLAAAAEALSGGPVGLAAQNLHPEPKGAFTGEVSAPMLTAIGCTHVILGHSERRTYFGETDEGVFRKLRAALDGGLTPIVCLGESLGERKAERTLEKVGFQVRAALAGLDPALAPKVVLAYEPIWAIGTGLTATPEQAQEVHAAIRATLGELFGADVAAQIRVQYGGSVKPANAADLLAQPDIDGALVGGASLKADSFAAIVEAAKG
jgi:triosephosphate isomerase